MIFSSFLVVACEEDPESVGGPVTDGYSSPEPSGRSGNRLSGGLSSSSSGGSSLEGCNPPYDVTAYGYPGPGWSWAGSFVWTFIGGGGGGGGNNAVVPSQAKLDFCLIEGTLQAIYDNWPILSDVSAIQSYAQTAAGIQGLIFAGAISDIKAWIASGGVMHAPPGHTSENTINWYSLNIDWFQYGSDTTGGAVTDADAIPIFANFMQQMGLGDGTVDLSNDPDPSVDCI